MLPESSICCLSDAVQTSESKVLNLQPLDRYGKLAAERPVLVILAAGKGTRFGQSPKCAQLVCGVPLARHSMNAFRSLHASPVICIVGYRYEEVVQTLGDDNVYVRSDNPAGGTAFAAFESYSVPGLHEANPVLIVTMGDRIVTASVFRQLYETHMLDREADLTLLTALYEPPRNQGKGRVLRDAGGRVAGIIEQRDIDLHPDRIESQRLAEITEGNCPLYAVRAATLRRYLARCTNDNAQGQYYFTDIVRAIADDGGEIRTITTSVAQPEYDLLCSDVTRPMDLALLEGILTSSALASADLDMVRTDRAVESILAGRPPGQVASIAEQLDELHQTAQREKLSFQPDRPVGIGISGGRVRVAFMHPDMGRFFGPAWQMPFGAADAAGREQIVVLVQSAEDGKIQLFPTDPQFREKLNFVAADNDCMYPGEDIGDWYSYEGFGTRMAENLLLSLGYFSDEELQTRREKGIPVPPPSLWVGNSLRRPFSLVGNAIASMRTLREGNLGAKVQTYLGRDGFRGLRVMSTGQIPQGGFSSSSAVTVAVKNAINSLFDLDIPSDMLVHLACQAEYGTGVRAGALDQATEQKGRAGQGTLISSNPRENYRIIGTYPVPADRYHVLFAYSVDRDREAWRWSAGCYAAASEPGRLTTAETRKMTGKAAELAAILTRLPLDVDYFQYLEPDLVQQGVLSPDTLNWVYEVLRQLPLAITQDELRERLHQNRSWYIRQLSEHQKLRTVVATQKADSTFESLLAGWRDPVMRCAVSATPTVEHCGAPLRAIVGYLFGEVAKNFYLIGHPDEWIQWITRSQWGDRCVELDPDALPNRSAMEGELAWEKGHSGPALLEQWLERYGARPFDYNRGLDDASLAAASATPLHWLEGTNFFRGLALIDLAEAMLKRAFGQDAIAVRVNAAGQGDFFQVHVDTQRAPVPDVEHFVRRAFYRRFGLAPDLEFFEPHPGAGAVGIRLSRFDRIPDLIRDLRVAK